MKTFLPNQRLRLASMLTAALLAISILPAAASAVAQRSGSVAAVSDAPKEAPFTGDKAILHHKYTGPIRIAGSRKHGGPYGICAAPAARFTKECAPAIDGGVTDVSSAG
jgi:hypothetical protein